MADTTAWSGPASAVGGQFPVPLKPQASISARPTLWVVADTAVTVYFTEVTVRGGNDTVVAAAVPAVGPVLVNAPTGTEVSGGLGRF